MSRSRKKTPRCGDRKSKYMKRLANHIFRHNKLNLDLPYMAYKKNFCSWNICDYEVVGLSFKRYMQGEFRRWADRNYRRLDYPDFKENKDFYDKWYIRK